MKKWLLSLGALALLSVGAVIIVGALWVAGTETHTVVIAPADERAPTAREVLEDAVEIAPDREPALVGRRVESRGIALTIHDVSATDNIEDIFTPADGNTFLILDVTLENTTRERAPYNPLYFKVKDESGSEYPNIFTIPAPALQSGELRMGEKVRGNVAFEVPADATGLIASYDPLLIADGYKEIRVDLGR